VFGNRHHHYSRLPLGMVACGKGHMNLILNDSDVPDTSYLDERWLHGGRIRLLPADEFKSVPWLHLRMWMHRHARYSLPTAELIEWLRTEMGVVPTNTIEIGAGNGDLGYHLGILSTDSYVQQTPEFKVLYAMQKQTPTNPAPDVAKIDANELVEQYGPEQVVGSYITRKYVEGKEAPDAQASVYGVDEEKLISGVQRYIHIGNEATHGRKTALSLPHRTYHFPWLITRGQLVAESNRGVIYVWAQ
jgi:hypothetical protein